MTRIIRTLDEIAPGYRVLYCDLWGCLHDGTRAFPAAVAALERFRARGGAVALLTNSPRPSPGVAAQLAALGAPRSCYDVIVSSGDAAQAAMGAGLFGRRVFHIGPERDLAFFIGPDGNPYEIERVPLAEAEGIVCTGLIDDRTETPEDYRAILLEARLRGLRMLCANPDIVVDVGDARIYCAGALGAAYAADGGEVFYFGKPHPPIYALARDRISAHLGEAVPGDDILCVGDGIATDVQGAMGENLDALLITGGLAAAETATPPGGDPDPARLRAFLEAARLSPLMAMGFLR
jgi:HAD superfamily hydrolase (TIGR01459 family)